MASKRRRVAESRWNKRTKAAFKRAQAKGEVKTVLVFGGDEIELKPLRRGKGK